MQNDFMPGGALGVPKADTLIPIINALMEEFPLVVATQDYHPQGHLSFAKNHKARRPFELITLEGLPQVLWPDHCVQGTKGAELVSGLNRGRITDTFTKGTDPTIDSYSAFFDNGKRKKTELDAYLKEKGVTDLYFVGVATDYCVLYSALDALDIGYRVFVIARGCKGIDLEPGGSAAALEKIRERGGSVL